MNNVSNSNQKIKVSILCLAYNHSKYIKKAIDSFLTQKTNFDFEIIIHDDFSTDNTVDIIKSYTSKYPEKIKTVFQKENQYSKKNGGILYKFLLPLAKGEYIAVCEGDDYWIDTKKIQKQVDFMDKNKDFSICFTKVKTLKNGKLLNDAHSNVYPKLLGDRTVFSLEDILLENFIATCSVMYRRKDMVSPKSATGLPFGDWTLNTLTAQNGKIKYINEAMAVYRVHQGGVWSSMSRYDREKTVLSFYSYINKYFKNKYSAIIIDKINNIALYNLQRNILNERRKKHIANLKSKYNLLYKKYNTLSINKKYLEGEYYNLINSLSWKLIMFIRLNILDILIPNRTGLLARIKNKLKDTRNVFQKYVTSIRYRPTGFTIKKWPTNRPLVSVIIPCYNYGKYVNEAISSVLAQTFQNFEIIVVDDGSTDKYTQKVLANINSPKTRVIHQVNGRLPTARNNGIKEAEGKYICCLDADDLIAPTYLEKTVYLLESKKLDICGSWLQEFEDGDFLWKTQKLNLQTLMNGNSQIVSSVFTKKIWQDVGGYSTKMNEGYEDWEFWISVAEKGGIGDVIPEPLFLYRKHGISMIDKAKEKHNRIVSDIKSIHHQLYNDTLYRQNIIDKANVNYIAKNPTINLDTSSYYAKKTNKKSVLLMMSWLTFGGAETLVYNYTSHLKNNFDISILTGLKSDNEWEYKFREVTKNIYHLPNMFSDESQRLDFITNYIKTRKVDVIHIVHNSSLYHLLPILKNRFPDIRVISTAFNTVSEHFNNSIKYAEYIDTYTTDNSLVLREYESQPDLVNKDKVVIHNGVDCNNKFNPINFDRYKERHKLGIKDNETAIYFIGRLSPEKNPHIFVEAAKDLLSQHKHLKFFMIGDGPMKIDIEDSVRDSQNKNLIYLGYQTDIAKYLSTADIFVLPSKAEGFPLSIVESMSMRVCTLASDVGGVSDAIIEGKNGFLMKPNSSKEMVGKIQEIINNKELIKEITVNARQTVVQNFSVEALTKKYRDIYAKK